MPGPEEEAKAILDPILWTFRARLRGGQRGANNGRWKGGLVNKICQHCGRVSAIKPSRLKRGRGKFCSVSCEMKSKKGDLHYRWQGEDIQRTCLNCGKIISIRPYQDKQGRGMFCSLSCHMINQRKSGIFQLKPNAKEIQLIELINKNRLPFKFVGDGEVWFGNRNPDFINTNGRKQVIELLGTYWHPLFDGANRLEHYKKYGFDCLVIWEDELTDTDKVLDKVKKFAKREVDATTR